MTTTSSLHSKVPAITLTFSFIEIAATSGDFFGKPHDEGGLDISRPLLSLFLLIFIVGLLPQRADVQRSRS